MSRYKQKVSHFENTLEKVSNYFGVARVDIFGTSKIEEKANARHFLWYGCRKKGLTHRDILDYSRARGMNCAFSTVTRGIESAKKKAKKDSDLAEFMEML